MTLTKQELQILHTLHLQNSEEVITTFPFRYELVDQKKYVDWEKGDVVSFSAILVEEPILAYYKGQQSYTRFPILLENEIIEVTVFNRPWISRFKVNDRYYFQGKYQGNQKINCSIVQKNELEWGILPIYRLSKGISQKKVRSLIHKVLHSKQWVSFIDDETLKKYRLCNRNEALHYLHEPVNQESLKQGMRHLKYEEFLKFQLQVQYRKKMNEAEQRRRVKKVNITMIGTFVKGLPFELSSGQRSVVKEMLDDLQSPQPMHRLLQGDVGCGKTIVSFIAAYANVLAGFQSVLLAPTQILAKQHYESACRYFEGTTLRITYLDASLRSKEKKMRMDAIEHNEYDFIIGTHAVLQEQVQFANLGLAIIDEQQRFGVEQRSLLAKKGNGVDQLFLSATPIPRTLAFSLFGDMDVSTIDTLPKNRQPKVTIRVPENSMLSILDEIKMHVRLGNQVYVVCPAITESEDVQSVLAVYNAMKKHVSEFEIGVVHGKLKTVEKDTVMHQFLQGEIQVLIATSIIEVGVDVANANIMVIYDAHRFGLSQLHQLRGRVGRHQEVGTCYLLSDSEEEDAIARLETLVHSENGFDIAKEDLRMRGFGDLLGQRQSGIPLFQIANIVEDEKILQVAREDAIRFVSQLHRYPMYQKFIQKKYLQNM